MTFYRSIILSALLLFYSFCCLAQDDNYVYRDSAILYEDSVEAAAKVENTIAPVQNDVDESQHNYIADTFLVNNQVFIEPDSIAAMKNLKPLAYAKNLDSLLYEYQQTLKKNEVDAKNEISWVGRFFLSPFTRYFFWLIGGVFVLFILYKLFFAEGFLQGSYARINVNLLPDEGKDLSQTADYGKLIVHAVSNKNYRLAVRYHYLQSLQKLSSKGLIQFVADKTNNQYVSELSGKKYKNTFASLTFHFEYVWYGEFEIDENVFNSIQNKFKQFNSEV